jgi:hypothetical protein
MAAMRARLGLREGRHWTMSRVEAIRKRLESRGGSQMYVVSGM